MRGAWCVAALLLACVPPPRPPQRSSDEPAAEIAGVLARSAADWNRGDLDGFMSDYARDTLTSYVSAGHVQYGWQPLYDHYRNAYFAPGKSRDSLSFEEIRVRALAPGIALATARFKLARGDSVVASGPFTLVLEKRNGRWRILHDHTSADPKP
jgi:uncharacterized protein (TIGR02246 family)